METRQTAVEWLMEQWEENSTSIWYSDFDKAKQMEKEQIVDAHGSKNRGGFKSNGEFFLDILTGEEYYNETYNNLNR